MAKNDENAGKYPVSLSEFIQAVKSDLVKSAMKRDDDFVALFEMQDIEVEVSVSVSRCIKSEGKLNIYAASIGASGEEGRESLHRVKLRMTPILVASEIEVDMLENDAGGAEKPKKTKIKVKAPHPIRLQGDSE